MQVLHEDFFYHSKSRLENDARLDNDRQSLAKDQKLCRSRARKFSLETNRRWKALHARRRQRDVQEERLREEILQQRRQQVQDVTERFQRAHLPPSQRYRQSFRRHALNIEDALNQIQGSSYTQRSSFLSSNTNISSCTPSPRPFIGGESGRPSLSAVDSYTELLQEQCRRVQHQDAGSPQAVLMGGEQEHFLLHLLFQIIHLSDSVSSKDSLEDEDGDHSSFFLHLEKTQPPQKEPSAFTSSGQTSYSVMRLINEHIAQSDDGEEGEVQKWPHNDFHVSKASAGAETSLKDFSSLSLYEKTSGGPFELASFPGSSIGLTVTDADAPPFSLLDFSQRSISGDRSRHKSAVLHFSEAGNNKDFYFEAPPKSEYFLKDDSSHDKTKDVTRRENADLRGSINNLDKVSDFKSETQKSSLHQSASNIQYEAQRRSDGLDPDSEIVFIKGILKKPLKHNSGDPPRPSAPGQLIFAKHVAAALRDSVELARAKAKSVEVSGAGKKKLRWFDEVHVEEKLKAKTSHPEGPNLIPGPAAAHHVTKEAWTDVGVQVNLPQEGTDEVKVHRSNGRTRSTRVRGAPVSSQTRKGTVMRPQYAADVRHIAKTQGKFMVPRPPPRSNRATKTPSVYHIQERSPTEGALPPRTADAAVTYAQPLSEACSESPGHPQTRSRRGAAGDEKRLCLDSTPTDEEISQLWHGVRCALNTKDAKNIQSQVMESRPSVRNQSRSLQTPQSRKETVMLIGPHSGFEGPTRFHLTDLHPGRPLEQNPASVAMDTAQTHSSGSVRRTGQQQELISISSEERRILVSLDRLNQQLHCLRNHPGANAGTGALVDTPSTKDVKFSSYKHHASPANRLRSQRKT
ncbi:centrosomal protein of 126 kDa isoform X3 [Oryzias melastigma]|uniref:centrosomal protein of 126 kDa isoform X3 n=1 Tax=Oryzias melastigma TaxID=30732 RepID=UPI000CF8300C|nr:centrosomal protein of 126 kDa isoform X3 [Oryzias melastigma]